MIAYLKDQFIVLISVDLPLWMVLIFLAIIVVVYLLYEKYFCDKEVLAAEMLSKPENEVVRYEDEEYAGVTWSPWMGTGDEFSDRRIWVDGPFCMTCRYELDKCEKSWFCVECKKRYKIPSQLRQNLQHKMIKIFTVKSSKSGGSKPMLN